MSFETWWNYFSEDPYEKVGRFMPDAFGNPITVRLARISWAYLDWLDENYERDGDWFFRENHKVYNPNECDFDEWMEGAVNGTYLVREKKGLPRPSWCPAATPAQYIDIDE